MCRLPLSSLKRQCGQRLFLFSNFVQGPKITASIRDSPRIPPVIPSTMVLDARSFPSDEELFLPAMGPVTTEEGECTAIGRVLE